MIRARYMHYNLRYNAHKTIVSTVIVNMYVYEFLRLAWSQYETSYLCYESRIASVPPPRNHIFCFNTTTVYVCIPCKSFEFKVVLKYSSGLYIPSIMQQFFCIQFHIIRKTKIKSRKRKVMAIILVKSSAYMEC